MLSSCKRKSLSTHPFLDAACEVAWYFVNLHMASCVTTGRLDIYRQAYEALCTLPRRQPVEESH